MWAAVRLFVKQSFCNHQWEAAAVRRYSVSPFKQKQEAEVALVFLRCKKCGAEFHRVADPTQGEK